MSLKGVSHLLTEDSLHATTAYCYVYVLHQVLMKIKVFSSHQVFMREKLCMREKYQFVKYSVCHVHFIDGSQKWFTLVNRWIKHGSVAVH